MEVSDFVRFLEYSRQFFLTGCLVVSVSQELCLNSVWSESMKYRASLSPFFSDASPCVFSVSGTLPKFCVVWKYEIQGVTLAFFSDSLPCGSESMKYRASLSHFFC